MFVTLKLRCRKSRERQHRLRVRASPTRRTRRAAAAPPASVARDAGSPQPRRGCSMKPKTSAPRPADAERAADEVDARALASAARARGMQRQRDRERADRDRHVQQEDHAPARDADQPAAEQRADHGGDAAPGGPGADRGPRSAPENVDVITASEAGVRSAPATPCRPRKTISVFEFGATAQSADATPNVATPSLNTRTSPKMSPSEPPTRISEPSVSRYASTIHCCAASPPPRSRWIGGRATLTTVASMKTIDEPEDRRDQRERAAPTLSDNKQQ